MCIIHVDINVTKMSFHETLVGKTRIFLFIDDVLKAFKKNKKKHQTNSKYHL